MTCPRCNSELRIQYSKDKKHLGFICTNCDYEEVQLSKIWPVQEKST